MHQAATILKILGFVSLITGSLVLGCLYSDAVHHMPTPAASISGSLG